MKPSNRQTLSKHASLLNARSSSSHQVPNAQSQSTSQKLRSTWATRKPRAFTDPNTDASSSSSSSFSTENIDPAGSSPSHPPLPPSIDELTIANSNIDGNIINIDHNAARAELHTLYSSLEQDQSTKHNLTVAATTRAEKLKTQVNRLQTSHTTLLSQTKNIAIEVEDMIEHTVEFTKRIRKATKNSKVVAPSLSPSTPTPTPTPKPNSDDSDSDSDDHPLPHPSPNKQSQKTLVSLNQSQITLQTNLDLLHQYVTNLQAHYKNEQKNLERSSKKCEKVLALQKSLEQQSLAIKEMEQTAETYKNQAHDIKQQVSERINGLLAWRKTRIEYEPLLN